MLLDGGGDADLGEIGLNGLGGAHLLGLVQYVDGAFEA
jgi:hypothetical protein